MDIMSQLTNFSARDAKNRFGELLDAARQAPVHITKNGREVAVMVSLEEYKRFEKAEDALWASRASVAHKEGYLSTKASKALLSELLDATD